MIRKRNLLFYMFLVFGLSMTLSSCAKDNTIGKSGGANLQSEKTEDMSAVSSDIVIEGNCYYVSTKGNDDNTGTSSAPWKTLQKAADTAEAGDTVYVYGGTYNEKLDFTNSGEEGKWISFKAIEGQVPIISGKGLAVGEEEESGLVVIHNQNYILFQGFEVTDYSSRNWTTPIGIQVLGHGTYISIIDCHIHDIRALNSDEDDCNAHAIAVYGTDSDLPIENIVIQGCEIEDNILGTSEALVLNGNVSDFAVVKNKIHDNDNIGIDMIGYEKTASKNDQARNGLCTDNKIWNISTKDNDSYKEISAGGIYVDGGRDIVIERNIIYACDIGIEAASEHSGRSTQNIIIRNNLIYDCKDLAGIAFGGYEEELGSAKNIKIYNNTLFNNDIHILIQYNCQSSTNAIKNNIFYEGTTFDGSQDNIDIESNYTSDPLFSNADEENFSLQVDSPVIDQGIDDELAGQVDLKKNPRISGEKIDIGAYEYQF